MPEPISDELSEYEPITDRTPHAGKRLAMAWTPWMGDWFTSFSPRNGNENAEGQWDQWVDLAIQILQHEATAITRPEAHAAAGGLLVKSYYTDVDVTLTENQLEELFSRTALAGGDPDV